MKQRYHLATLPWATARTAGAPSRHVALIAPAYRSHIVAPHLGLGYLAAALRRAGHRVTVIDGLREEVRIPADVDLVGVTAMTTYFPEAIAVVKRAQALGHRVIIGGPHVIADPEGSLLQSGADYACAGEGEIALVELVSGVPVERISGLLYRHDGVVVRGASPAFHTDLDDFGEPAWDLIDPRSYPLAPHGMVARHHPLAPIITTRGCPYQCSYCSAPTTAGRRMRFRDPVRVVDEIERLVVDYGVREIQIEDDNFTLSREHAVAVCEELIRRDVGVEWSLPNGVRIDRLDPELLRLMRRSGCYMLALGIESANPRILEMVDKRIDVAAVPGVVAMVAEAGIEPWGFFMLGFPTETRAEIWNTVELALSLPLARCQFTRTTPLPGTPIYDLYRAKSGRDIDWSNFNYYRFEADWAEVDAEEIGRIQRLAHLRFYGRPKNFFAVLRSLRVEQLPYAVRRVADLANFRVDDLRPAEPPIVPEPAVASVGFAAPFELDVPRRPGASFTDG